MCRYDQVMQKKPLDTLIEGLAVAAFSHGVCEPDQIRAERAIAARFW